MGGCAERAIPTIARLFGSNDRAIRRSLLEAVDMFAAHFSEETVEEKIFPAIAAGLAPCCSRAG